MIIEIVLPAIDLDNETMLEADKINDKTLTRRLSPKVVATRPP
jgi:hypothetical protein